MIAYLATVHKDPDSDYGVQFYDFPGCITAGETIEEAKLMALEALTGHLALMIADGDEIPSPSNLETIVSQPEQNEAIAFMVIQIPDEIFIVQPEKQLALK